MISATRNRAISIHCETLTDYFSLKLQEYYFFHLLIAKTEEDTKLRLAEFLITSESQKGKTKRKEMKGG